jgi:hypothetical protein
MFHFVMKHKSNGSVAALASSQNDRNCVMFPLALDQVLPYYRHSRRR